MSWSSKLARKILCTCILGAGLERVALAALAPQTPEDAVSATGAQAASSSPASPGSKAKEPPKSEARITPDQAQ